MPRFNATRNQMVRGGGEDESVYTANGAIEKTDGVHAIAKTSEAAMTLEAPTADEDGLRLVITARTAFAHTVVIAAGIGGKGAAFDTLTFAAVGDTIQLLADNGKWVPVGAPYGVVIS